ncbi:MULTISPECIES: CidA/LrgA family protein [Pantoea]|uniref:CidA/LrgA family protein n=1 Tax=Pantoea eucrina TaxID=472693 RepID=A0ABS1Z4N2_9GAMM|nr:MULTISPECIES: CidA/LrgA family protein [Pantoea]AIX50029.1 LrgA [Pantoea sp. PSNIH1]PPS57797.1 CidA/LrgA family protein [Pantoea sp. BRM17]KAA5967484.1 CidA/LrgA family protein [Pantoea sp. M_9]MBM0747386.1 CidA/LrgA family protein [Pantoea eucrina]UBB13505.1 CidA/LrgA family protein [Pantoea eucrina]
MAAAINPRPRLLQHLILPLQLLLYIGLFSVCDLLVRWLHLPLPANVLGMVVLLLLIVLRVLPLGWVRAGANWLLAEMLLFFIPAVVAVVNYSDLLRSEGWRIFIVIAISTLLVLAVTSLVVDRLYRFEMARAARRQDIHE